MPHSLFAYVIAVWLFIHIRIQTSLLSLISNWRVKRLPSVRGSWYDVLILQRSTSHLPWYGLYLVSRQSYYHCYGVSDKTPEWMRNIMLLGKTKQWKASVLWRDSLATVTRLMMPGANCPDNLQHLAYNSSSFVLPISTNECWITFNLSCAFIVPPSQASSLPSSRSDQRHVSDPAVCKRVYRTWLGITWSEELLFKMVWHNL